MTQWAKPCCGGMTVLLFCLFSCSSIDSVWRIAPEAKSSPSTAEVLVVRNAQFKYEIQASARFGARTATGPCLLPIFSHNEDYFNGQLVRMTFRVEPFETGRVIRLRKQDLAIQSNDGRTHTPGYIQAFRVHARGGRASVFYNWDRGAAGIQVDGPVRFEMEYGSARYGELKWFLFHPRFSLDGKEFTGRPVKLIPRVSRKYNLFQMPFAFRTAPR